MPGRLIVPVAAHRLYGTRWVLQKPSVRRGGVGFEVPLVEYALAAAAPRLLLPEVDLTHGTRRSLEEVRALFQPDPSLAYTRGFTVNDIWRAAEVEFQLLLTRDHMIDTHFADLLPQDSRIFDREEFDRSNNVADALNVYFARSIVGAWGVSSLRSVGAAGPDLSAAFVGDRYDPDAPTDRADAFRRSVITVAHEIGHVLGLPHMPEFANVMYGNGTTDDSTELLATQRAIARYRAQLYRTLTVLDPMPHLAWDWRGRLPFGR